jgi:hypothetical protein
MYLPPNTPRGQFRFEAFGEGATRRGHPFIGVTMLHLVTNTDDLGFHAARRCGAPKLVQQTTVLVPDARDVRNVCARCERRPKLPRIPSKITEAASRTTAMVKTSLATPAAVPATPLNASNEGPMRRRPGSSINLPGAYALRDCNQFRSENPSSLPKHFGASISRASRRPF